MVRVHASHSESLWFEPDSMPRLNARSLFTQQQMGTQWEHWGDKCGKERNWPPYLTCQWLRISVLSNRHSPTYESIWDYLCVYKCVHMYMYMLICICVCICIGTCVCIYRWLRISVLSNRHSPYILSIREYLYFKDFSR